MKIEYKVFRFLLFFLISIPFYFFSYILVQKEYKEWFVYGNIIETKILNINYEDGGMDHGDGTDIIIEITYKEKKYKARENFKSSIIKGNKGDFINNVKENDEIIVKLLNNKTVKILFWEGKKINNNKINFGAWIIILLLFSCGCLCCYYIYKTFKI